jgi:hypothetical protein
MSDPILPPSTPGLNPQLGPAALGAANGVLFGLPEAAIKAIGGDKVRQIVDAYKAKNEGYGAGETAGSVASMFIPGGAIAKGLGAGAKALGAAKLGEGLTKVGKVASGPMGLKQGLAAAAEQAVPRAVSEQVDTGDTGKTASDLALGVAGGGVLGKGMGTVGKLATKYIPPRPMEEIGEGLNDQILSNVFGRDLTRGIRQVTKNSGGSSAQIEKIEDVKNIIVDQLEKNGIGNKQAAEDLLGENGQAWQKIGQNMNDAVANGQVKSLAELPDDMFTHPDMIDALKYHGPKAEDALLDLATTIGRVADDPANTFAKTREVLNKTIQTGFKTGNADDLVKSDVASAMKNYFDQKAMEVAPPDTDIAKLKEIYPAFLAMGKALARDKATVAPAFTPGSDTFARFVTAMSPGGDVVQAVTGNIAGQALNKAATAGANLVGTELASKLRGMLPRGPNGMPLELADLPQGVKDAAALAGKSAGTGLERAAGPAMGAVMSPEGQPIEPATPLPNPTFPAPGSGQEQAIAPKPIQPVGAPAHPLDPYLERAWQLEDPQGLIEQSRPGTKQAFMSSVRQNLTNKDGSVNYQRAGNLLFPDNPEDAKKYTESYTTLQKVQQGLPNAVRLVTINNPKAEADKQSVIDTVSEVLKKNQGMKEEQAGNVVKGILGNPLKTPAEKSTIIMNLLRTADPIAFGKGGVLERGGVLK